MRQKQIIDYTHRRWGHNIEILSHEQGDRMRGFVWHRLVVHKGDHMTWRTEYGTVTAEVEEVRPCGDPPDMYGVTLRVVERVSDKAGVIE